MFSAMDKQDSKEEEETAEAGGNSSEEEMEVEKGVEKEVDNDDANRKEACSQGDSETGDSDEDEAVARMLRE